ncbi:acyl-CoA dehydrogenase family protein [Dactylosporangium sp. NPDC049525]|uniref:acyl-CoA dehydrogenase family protein n=1 Tax=Dactylosporangium sp. NPDC049525 TaxID=3154730 RepID=UPI003414C75A
MTDAYAKPELRDLVRNFTRKEIVPHLGDWERAGEVPRSLHRKAAEIGLLGIGFPEEVGGEGGDLTDTIVVTEEIIQSGGSSGLIAALFTHGIALPHIIGSGNAELIDRFVRPTLRGELIGCLAITEPDGGSDVAGIRTTAKADGDQYTVNGSKTFITSGARADFATTAVRTEDGVRLLVVPAGFTVTRTLEKMGWHCSDTAELSFVDVRVPRSHDVGGIQTLLAHFAAERISLAVQCYATAQRCLDLTLAWVRDRHTFGRPLASRQVVKHRLAEMARQVDVARTYVRHTARRVASGERLVTEVAMAKNTAVAACDHVVDQAVQLHGGLGYLRDAEVERHYRDARIMGIGGGTTEIMNEIIAKQLGV